MGKEEGVYKCTKEKIGKFTLYTYECMRNNEEKKGEVLKEMLNGSISTLEISVQLILNRADQQC